MAQATKGILRGTAGELLAGRAGGGAEKGGEGTRGGSLCPVPPLLLPYPKPRCSARAAGGSRGDPSPRGPGEEAL